MANKQMESVLSAFRTEVEQVEAFGEDAINSLKVWRKIRQTLDHLSFFADEVGYALPDALDKVYEDATNNAYNPNEVSDNRKKVEAMLMFAEDFGLDKGVVTDLLSRYDNAMDRIGQVVSEPEAKASKGARDTSTGRYGNTHDAFRGDNLGGVKRHLTKTLPGWYGLGVRVTEQTTDPNGQNPEDHVMEDEGKPA